MAFRNSTCIFLLFLSLAAALPQNLPDVSGKDLGKNKYGQRVRECFLKDKTKFNQCLLEFWKTVAPLLKTGIPEINIPVMDPLRISRLDFKEHGSSVKAEATFTNIVVVGASQLQAKSIKIDKKARTAAATISFPRLSATGDYVINGEILMLPIDGKGKFTLDLGHIDAVATLHLIQKGTGVAADRMMLDFDIKTMSVRLDGLLGGDSVGEAVNAMLNENGQTILGDIKPSIAAKFQEVFLNMTKDAFIDMPPEAFIA
ncbi:hypothetical protein CHUAL_009825 [Chamberlinius hualienensis]